MSLVNKTVITLIPKVKDPVRMTQLRPISLCMVVCKIVSKVLVNRMKPFLSACIDDTQAAFLKGRLISDNILIAHELIHYLNSSKNGSNKGAAIKLDMAKAFDRQQEGRIRCIRASQQGPRINQLLYADDSIVFIRNSPQEATRLMEVLRMFADSSRQCINFHKPAIYFSPVTATVHRRHISNILCISETTDPGIYLGVPLRVDKNKTNTFGFLTERVDDRIKGWSKHLLSFGGREIFLKSVAQSLPQYIMSCYLLPRTITDHIVRSMHRYWWSDNNKDRGCPLIAWDNICSPKAAGGLGFRDLRSFNVALLGKIIWRLLTEPSTLLARVYLAKYFPTGHLLEAKLRDHASFAWKGIYATMQELQPDRLDSLMLCSDFMSTDFSAWDPTRLLTFMDPMDVRIVLSVPISVDRSDRLLWAGHDSGIFSVRSGYFYLRRSFRHSSRPSPVWKVIAKLDVLPKVCIFAWRLGRDGLPTRSRIHAAGLGPGQNVAPALARQGNAWTVLPMTPLPSSLYRARFLWSGLCIAWQVRALAMPSRWGEFVTPTRPTTRGFGHVDARSRWLCATPLDNVTPNTGRHCVATVLGSVSRPSNVRASDLIKSQLRASCIELSSCTPLQCPPLLAVEPKGCDRDPVLRT
ncbi:hypothetical protein GQ457_12G013680 [Hibiscus cannabinus]